MGTYCRYRWWHPLALLPGLTGESMATLTLETSEQPQPIGGGGGYDVPTSTIPGVEGISVWHGAMPVERYAEPPLDVPPPISLAPQPFPVELGGDMGCGGNCGGGGGVTVGGPAAGSPTPIGTTNGNRFAPTQSNAAAAAKAASQAQFPWLIVALIALGVYIVYRDG